MIYFDQPKQAFYQLEKDPNNPDYVELTTEQHQMVLQKLNQGYYVFKDLTTSPRKPSIYHEWKNGQWVDPRTPEQIEAIELASLRPLTRRQFKLTLLQYNMLSTIEQRIAEVADPTTRTKLQIEYTEATEFHRTSPSVLAMIQILGLSSVQVNTMWKWGLTQ